MLPLIEREVVEKKKWMESEQFMDLVAVAQSAPGVLAVNMAVSVGYQLAGVMGAIVATIGAVFFSFLIIILIAVFLTNFQDNQYIQGFFKGVAPAVTMLLLSAAFNIGRKAVKDKGGFILVAVGLPSLIILGIHPIWAILVAGIFGALYYKT